MAATSIKPRKIENIRDFDADITGEALSLPSGSQLEDVAERLAKEYWDDPDFVVWVEAQVVSIIHDRLRRVLMSERSKLVHRKPIDMFQAAIERGQEIKPRAIFDAPYSCDAEGTWKTLGDMNSDDLKFAADSYAAKANAAKMHESFLVTLAKKVGTKTVREVFTPEQVESVRTAIFGNA